jgi:hypothetical protein
MRAIIIAASLSANGSAQVIARTADVILFGTCYAVDGSARTFWTRAIFKDGTNRALSLHSLKSGHEEPLAANPELAMLLGGEAPSFVVAGDVFELDSIELLNERREVRMSQDAFDFLMRSLLND